MNAIVLHSVSTIHIRNDVKGVRERNACQTVVLATGRLYLSITEEDRVVI